MRSNRSCKQKPIRQPKDYRSAKRKLKDLTKEAITGSPGLQIRRNQNYIKEP